MYKVVIFVSLLILNCVVASIVTSTSKPIVIAKTEELPMIPIESKENSFEAQDGITSIADTLAYFRASIDYILQTLLDPPQPLFSARKKKDKDTISLSSLLAALFMSGSTMIALKLTALAIITGKALVTSFLALMLSLMAATPKIDHGHHGVHQGGH